MVISNLIMRLIFKQAMAMLFGAIIMIQILAHLPLADMADLPASAAESFEIMQGIVSFDYFQPTEFITVDFTETPPWSERFDILDYGSINFVEGMGSIIVFFTVQILYGITSVFFACFGFGCCSKRIKEFF